MYLFLKVHLYLFLEALCFKKYLMPKCTHLLTGVCWVSEFALWLLRHGWGTTRFETNTGMMWVHKVVLGAAELNPPTTFPEHIGCYHWAYYTCVGARPPRPSNMGPVPHKRLWLRVGIMEYSDCAPPPLDHPFWIRPWLPCVDFMTLYHGGVPEDLILAWFRANHFQVSTHCLLISYPSTVSEWGRFSAG